MEQRTAIVFGATGLVGNLLLEELGNTGNYSAIRIFVRQSTGISSPDVEEIITDFSNISRFGAKIKGDDLFICLGTTIKKAGSIENMENIDRDLCVEIALLARQNGVSRIAVVSLDWCRPILEDYYLRIKGRWSRGILAAGFEKTVIVRPSMLMGGKKGKAPGRNSGQGGDEGHSACACRKAAEIQSNSWEGRCKGNDHASGWRDRKEYL